MLSNAKKPLNVQDLYSRSKRKRLQNKNNDVNNVSHVDVAYKPATMMYGDYALKNFNYKMYNK
jgi:hypothetical protein